MPRSTHRLFGKLQFLSTFARLGLVLVLLTGLLGDAAASTLADGEPRAERSPPASLSFGDWATIQELIRQAEYYLTWHEPSAAYTAPNRAHGLGVAFSATGVRVTPRTREEEGWEWGLALTGWGYGQDVRPVAPAELAVSDKRIEYRRGELTEWYVNDESGLEQGFTLQAPPIPAGEREPGGEGLVLEMALSGDLAPRLADGGQAILFASAAGETALRYGKLIAYDADGQRLPAHLSLSPGGTLHIVVDDEGAAYPLTIDPLLTGEVAKLTASGGGAFDDCFGKSVAISGDTVVVGEYQDDIGPNADQGSAYVFERNEGGADDWDQVQKLIASDGAASDHFGTSVAISGDTVVVGSPNDDILGILSRGSAYVFERNYDPSAPGTPSADNWGQRKKLTASDGAQWDYFGSAVAISGDTIAVGANSDDVDGIDQGSAYIFERNYDPSAPGTPSADNWGQRKKLTASDGAAGDLFGRSIAIDVDTVVVGASSDNVGGIDEQGSAYVFERNYDPSAPGTPSADNWGQRKKLTASDGAMDDFFGRSVAISGDTAVVGANSHDVGGTLNQGAAYIFERNYGGTDNWGQRKELTASDGEGGDWFGWSVSISGDTVVVGASEDDVGGTLNQGSAYIFERNYGGADNWGQEQKLISSDGALGDRFGYSIAISGDTVVVGAYNKTVGGTIGQGAAYTFVRSGNAWVQRQKPTYGAAGDRFGYSVAIDGDTIVVGARWGDVGLSADRGSAYVLERNQGGADEWGQVEKLFASDGAVNDEFGHSVAISGDTVVVGARGDDVSLKEDQGSAYVFERNQGGADNWGQVEKLVASDGAAGDEFGYSVSISGDTVVAGAYGDNSYQGSAYVFARNRGGADEWDQVQKLTATDGGALDYFGFSVAISVDTVVAGAFRDNVGGNSYQGSAYIFARNQGGADNWGQVQKLTASDGAADDRFGVSVAISGDTVAVGAPYDDIGSNGNQGSAYIFERNQSGADNWGQVQKLIASDGAGNDFFGESVAISVDTAVVGAWGDDVGSNNNQGSACIFERNRGGADEWGQVQKLIASDGATNDGFGDSVAISGYTIVVGADGDDVDGDADQGSAYVYSLDMRFSLLPIIMKNF